MALYSSLDAFWVGKACETSTHRFQKYKQIEYDDKDYWYHLKEVFQKWPVKSGSAEVKVRERNFASLFLEK